MSKKNEFGLPSAEYEKLYGVWNNMISRCYKQKDDRFYAYGERGIKVCEEWKSSFKDFARWAVQNGWSTLLSIERNDVDGNYCPENCCFITMREQMRNKTSNVYLVINNEKRCLTEWCEIFGVEFKTVWARLKTSKITDPEILFYKGDLRELRPDILQLDPFGNVISRYCRITEAQNSTGISSERIRGACKRKGVAGDYRWRYADD